MKNDGVGISDQNIPEVLTLCQSSQMSPDMLRISGGFFGGARSCNNVKNVKVV